MASLTIRNVPDATKEALRVQAAQAGVSLEAHVRYLLEQSAQPAGMTGADLLALARKYFGPENGVDLDLPDRREAVERPVDFGE